MTSNSHQQHPAVQSLPTAAVIPPDPPIVEAVTVNEQASTTLASTDDNAGKKDKTAKTTWTKRTRVKRNRSSYRPGFTRTEETDAQAKISLVISIPSADEVGTTPEYENMRSLVTGLSTKLTEAELGKLSTLHVHDSQWVAIFALTPPPVVDDADDFFSDIFRLIDPVTQSHKFLATGLVKGAAATWAFKTADNKPALDDGTF